LLSRPGRKTDETAPHSEVLVQLEIVRSAGLVVGANRLDMVVFYLPDAAAQEARRRSEWRPIEWCR